MSDFSSDVKSIRQSLGLSQEELARELGVSFATVNRWENSKTTPSQLALKTFQEFCEKMRQEGKLKG